VKRRHRNLWLFSLTLKCSNPFTLSSVKRDTLSLALVATVVVVSDPLMGRSNLQWVSKIYYCLIACLGDQGLNSRGHPVRSGSPPDLGKHALRRRRRQVPVCGQVHRHIDLGQIGLSPSNKFSGIYYRRFKGYMYVSVCGCHIQQAIFLDIRGNAWTALSYP